MRCRTRAIWPFVLVVLLTFPSVSAEPAIFVSGGEYAADGVAKSIGEGIALRMEVSQRSRTVPQAWHIEAEEIRAEIEWSEQDSPVFPVTLRETGRGRDVVGNFTDAVAAPMDSGDGAIFFLAGGQDTSIEATHLEWEYQAGRTVRENGILEPTTDPIEAVLTAGVQPHLENGTLRIHGDFAFMVWDWDIHVNSRNGSLVVENGYSREPTAPGGPWEGPGKAYDQQAYIYVQNGTFVLHLDDAINTAVWQNVQQLTVDGLFSIAGARRIEGLADGAAKDMELQGYTEARVIESGGGQQFELAGDWSSVLADGRVVPLPDESPGRSIWPSFLILALVAPAYVAVYAGRRHWLKSQMEELEADLDLAQYDQALRRADKLLRPRRTRADAALLKTVALLRLGRVDEAEAFLERPWPGPLASWHFLKATVDASLGRTSEAQKHLDQCLEDAPEFALEVESSPVLRPLLARMQPSTSFHMEGYE